MALHLSILQIQRQLNIKNFLIKPAYNTQSTETRFAEAMSDIFICYSRKDIDAAMRLVHLFEAEGWRVFIDKQTHVGRRWHKEIENELHATRAVATAVSGSGCYVRPPSNSGSLARAIFRRIEEGCKTVITTAQYPSKRVERCVADRCNRSVRSFPARSSRY